jgi:hypothetical protein
MELRIALDIDAKQVSYLVNQLARMGFVEKHADSFSDHGRIINGTRVYLKRFAPASSSSWLVFHRDTQRMISLLDQIPGGILKASSAAELLGWGPVHLSHFCRFVLQVENFLTDSAADNEGDEEDDADIETAASTSVMDRSAIEHLFRGQPVIGLLLAQTRNGSLTASLNGHPHSTSEEDSDTSGDSVAMESASSGQPDAPCFQVRHSGLETTHNVLLPLRSFSGPNTAGLDKQPTGARFGTTAWEYTLDQLVLSHAMAAGSTGMSAIEFAKQTGVRTRKAGALFPSAAQSPLLLGTHSTVAKSRQLSLSYNGSALGADANPVGRDGEHLVCELNPQRTLGVLHSVIQRIAHVDASGVPECLGHVAAGLYYQGKLQPDSFISEQAQHGGSHSDACIIVVERWAFTHGGEPASRAVRRQLVIELLERYRLVLFADVVKYLRIIEAELQKCKCSIFVGELDAQTVRRLLADMSAKHQVRLHILSQEEMSERLTSLSSMLIPGQFESDTFMIVSPPDIAVLSFADKEEVVEHLLHGERTRDQSFINASVQQFAVMRSKELASASFEHRSSSKATTAAQSAIIITPQQSHVTPLPGDYLFMQGQDFVGANDPQLTLEQATRARFMVPEVYSVSGRASNKHRGSATLVRWIRSTAVEKLSVSADRRAVMHYVAAPARGPLEDKNTDDGVGAEDRRRLIEDLRIPLQLQTSSGGDASDSGEENRDEESARLAEDSESLPSVDFDEEPIPVDFVSFAATWKEASADSRRRPTWSNEDDVKLLTAIAWDRANKEIKFQKRFLYESAKYKKWNKRISQGKSKARFPREHAPRLVQTVRTTWANVAAAVGLDANTVERRASRYLLKGAVLADGVFLSLLEERRAALGVTLYTGPESVATLHHDVQTDVPEVPDEPAAQPPAAMPPTMKRPSMKLLHGTYSLLWAPGVAEAEMKNALTIIQQASMEALEPACTLSRSARSEAERIKLTHMWASKQQKRAEATRDATLGSIVEDVLSAFTSAGGSCVRVPILVTSNLS